MPAPDDPSLESSIDSVYGEPYAAFVIARDALASVLRAGGQRDEAKRVKALAKPSLSAWVVNQLYRSHYPALRLLLDAGDDARRAQRLAIAGEGGSVELRKATRALYAQLSELRRIASAILREDSTRPTPAVLDRVVATLKAIAESPEGHRKLEGGRLLRDVDPPGLDVLEGLEEALAKGAARAPRGVPSNEAEPSAEHKRETERRARAEREKARKLAEQQAQLEAAEENVAEARAEVRELDYRADEAAERLEQAKARLQAALEAARTAAEEARAARAHLEAGEARVLTLRGQLGRV